MKKIIVPIIITIVLTMYFLLMIFGIANISASPILNTLGIMLYLVLIVINISVLIERIKEIRSSEKDDLSKY